MDDLILSFQRGTTLTFYNPTPYDLFVHDGCVYSNQWIARNTRLGELHGTPCYIWDMTHHDYMIVHDEMVLDVSENCPRSILTYVHEENQSSNPANCVVTIETCDVTGKNMIFLDALRNIQPLEEVVYTWDMVHFF